MNYELRSLIETLNENGIHVIADRAFDKIEFDFSEHDKKVAEEKDKRIAELEKIIDEKSGGWGKFGLTLSEIIELQDRHQSDCIRINQLLTTIDVLTERYQKLREIHGL